MSSISTLPTSKALYQAYLTKQGLDKTDERALGMALVEPGDELANKLRGILGYPVTQPCALIMSPYWPKDYVRLRVLGEVPKGASRYLSPEHSGHGHPLLSPTFDWPLIKTDPGTMLVITEGEVKAYWGCKTGVPTVGLPGVTMHAPLFNGEWEWKGRSVLVAFDHDPGYGRGGYKPQVLRSLGELCYRLEAAGAAVKVIRIGMVDSLDPEQKWGLDDALRHLGATAWEQLAGVTGTPPEWCEFLSYFDNNCVVMDFDKPEVYDLKNGTRRTFEAFTSFYAKWSRNTITQGGKPKVEQVAPKWLSNPNRPEAKQYVYDPNLAVGYLPEAKLVNLWEPLPDFSDRGEWEWSHGIETCRSPVLEFDYLLQRHFGEHKDLFCQWVGHMLTRPGESTTLSFCNRSNLKGNGKSLIGLLIRKIVGPTAGREIDPDLEMGSFSVHNKDKSIFEDWPEVNLLGKVSSGRIRNMLSAEEVSVHPKGLTAFSIRNIKRHYFTTNESAPFKVDADERRLVVVEPNVLADEFELDFREWVQWFAEFALGDVDFLGDAQRYFTGYPGLEMFNPHKWAPNTESLLQVAEAGQTSSEAAIDNLAKRVGEEVSEWFAIGASVKGKNKLLAAIRNKLKTKGWTYATKKVSVMGGAKVDAHIFAKPSFGLEVEVNKAYQRACIDPRLEPSNRINPIKESMSAWDAQFSSLFADWEGGK